MWLLLTLFFVTWEIKRNRALSIKNPTIFLLLFLDIRSPFPSFTITHENKLHLFHPRWKEREKNVKESAAVFVRPAFRLRCTFCVHHFHCCCRKVHIEPFLPRTKITQVYDAVGKKFWWTFFLLRILSTSTADDMHIIY